MKTFVLVCFGRNIKKSELTNNNFIQIYILCIYFDDMEGNQVQIPLFIIHGKKILEEKDIFYILQIKIIQMFLFFTVIWACLSVCLSVCTEVSC